MPDFFVNIIYMSEFFVPKKIPKEAMEYINKKGYQLIFAKGLTTIV